MLTKKIFFLFLFILPILSVAQEASAPKAPPTTKVQRQIAKKKWKNERRIKRDAEKNIKEHDKKLQTKQVRKRMKKNKNKSKRINDNKKDFFLKRWFTKKL